jgi:hypothetical protein
MLKRSLIVRSLALAVAAVSLCAQTSAVHAAPIGLGALQGGSVIPVDAQQIQVNQRPPIPFKPFPLADLRTGQPLAPGAIITLKNGKQMRADAFFAQLNDLERQFNAMGFTLRQPGVFKLKAMAVDQQQLQTQKTMLNSLPPVTAAVQTTAPAGGAFHTAGLISRVVRGIPIAGVLTPTTPAPAAASMSKTWDQSFGSRDTVGAGLTGELNVVGSQDGVNASAVARAYGAILDHEWDLVRVTGNLKAPKSGGGTIQVNLHVVGLGDTSFTSLTGDKTRQLDVSEKFPIPIGPFTLNAKIGVRGSAGVQYGATLKPAGVNVSITPKVQVAAYGQGGIDLGIAEGGVGAELTLLKSALQLGAEGECVTFLGRNALKARTYGAGSLEALSGRLYAYAKVDVVFWSDEWQTDIWSFEGFKKDYTLFNESKTILFAGEPPLVVNPAVLTNQVTVAAP